MMKLNFPLITKKVKKSVRFAFQPHPVLPPISLRVHLSSSFP